ncbi:hypothetical protein KEM54_003825, partial [Ascosphaera aggregata]
MAAEKQMSSRLLTMKFMQRAAAASASKQSSSSSSSSIISSSKPPSQLPTTTTTSTTTPSIPSPKRQRLSGSSNLPSHSDHQEKDKHIQNQKNQQSTPDTLELAQISAAIKAEEEKRVAALDRQAAEAGESRWVLYDDDDDDDDKYHNSLARNRIEHWSSGYILPGRTMEEEEENGYGNGNGNFDDHDDSDGSSGSKTLPGRRTFG